MQQDGVSPALPCLALLRACLGNAVGAGSPMCGSLQNMAWGPQYGIKPNPAVPGGAPDVQGVLFEARMQQDSTSSVKHNAVCCSDNSLGRYLDPWKRSCYTTRSCLIKKLSPTWATQLPFLLYKGTFEVSPWSVLHPGTDRGLGICPAGPELSKNSERKEHVEIGAIQPGEGKTLERTLEPLPAPTEAPGELERALGQ